MKSLNPNIHPHDGFFFKETDGTTIHADSWAGVIKRLTIYRQRAGYPAGNPSEEVIAQACARNPVVCHEQASLAEAIKRLPLKSRVLTWLNRTQADRSKQYVDEATARARAAICATCSKNTDLPGGCASCKAAVKILREKVIDRRFQDGRLRACDALGEDLPASVHLEAQAVEDPALPPQCWRKRTL